LAPFLWLLGAKLEETTFCPQCKIEVPDEDFLFNGSNHSYSRKKGGCKDCSRQCDSCSKIIALEESDFVDNNGETLTLCENCLNQDYINCDICNKYFSDLEITFAEDKGHNDEGYVEGEGKNVCENCLSKYYEICVECKQPVSNNDVTIFFDSPYHDTCIPDEQPELLDYSSIDKTKFQNFSWSEQEHILDFLEKIVPISVQQIKKNYQNLYLQIQELIKENNGKDFTLDYINLKKQQLKPKVFNVDYSAWLASQRSFLQDEPQIILKIQANDEFLSIIDSNPYYSNLFQFSQLSNNTRGHPWSNNSLGWTRLEINNIEKYILVDEIQTDYPIYCAKIINSIKNKSDKHLLLIEQLIKTYNKNTATSINSLDEQAKDYIISQIKSFQKLFDKFPSIALSAIEKFAKANNFKKIYYPTLGTLIELRGHKNDDGTPSKKLPSKEIYKNLPKKHFYENKGNYPFNFKDLEFYEKNASINKISNLFLKRINKL
jgi:hypothetical protein